MLTPLIRFRIDFTDNVNLGPGKIALLEAVKSTGSISDAARALGMSYRRAWILIDSIKQGFSEAVIVAATGGKGGGGARVTAFGELLIDQYRKLEREITRLGAHTLSEILPRVIERSGVEKPARKRLAKRIS
jgi:molybdate transport system regulatory protein